MKDIDANSMACLNDERKRLHDEIRKCDFCSSSVEEHSHCYEETARDSGQRSKACFH